MSDRFAEVLELDDAAVLVAPPPDRTDIGCSPMLAWRVGHFAVARTPENLVGLGPNGQAWDLRPWTVLHVASSAIVLDFQDRDEAWRMADEISVACGDRIESEPRSLAELCALVPDVVRWVQQLAAAGFSAQRGRPFMRFARWLEAIRGGVAFPLKDDRTGAFL